MNKNGAIMVLCVSMVQDNMIWGHSKSTFAQDSWVRFA